MTGRRVSLVVMTPEHVDELMPYERAMFGTEAWTASGYRTELADTARRYYRVAAGDARTGGPGAATSTASSAELLGWAGVMVVADTAEILTVGVIPAARRRGIARQLLDDLLAEARRRGAVQAFLEVRVDNDAARALYARAGFAQVGLRRGYYDGGRIDAAVMCREL